MKRLPELIFNRRMSGYEVDYFGSSLQGALETLSVSMENVIRDRFFNNKTLSDIGMVFQRSDGGVGVGKERIRQIKKKAIRMLRHPKRTAILTEQRAA